MTSPTTNTVTDDMVEHYARIACSADGDEPAFWRDYAAATRGVLEALSTHPHSEREDRPTGREEELIRALRLAATASHEAGMDATGHILTESADEIARLSKTQKETT
jgi:hypothetical protein